MNLITPTNVKSSRLGEILCDIGATSSAQVDRALAVQQQTQALLGEIMVANGWVRATSLTTALAVQAGHDVIALQPGDLDPARMATADLDVCLRRRLFPLRSQTGEQAFVAADPLEAAKGLAELSDPQPDAVLYLADLEALDAVVLTDFGPDLARRAARRCPAASSARSPMPLAQRVGLFILALMVMGGFVLAPLITLATLFTVLVMLNAMNAIARIAVLGAALRRPRDPVPLPDNARALADSRPPPVMTLLIPLLREPEVLPLLMEALDSLDWPHHRLEVLLLLEEGDDETREALAGLRLPNFVRCLSLPPGAPRTKPRALNLALDFARGDIIGIYDAEDRPEPDQLRRVATILRESPPEVACVQCRLAYYNPRENWITRCFAIEYTMWFDVLIAGFRDLRLPIPLGGTSVFFRRRAIEALGGWDAHNVTEDAELGMRLAREGYRCEVSVSTTYEEANSRVMPWIRQRSRWLKGYMMTWLVHMRRPLGLWTDLGPLGFMGFQAVFLGAIVAYLGLPLFWSIWAAVLLGHGPAWMDAQPLWVIGVVAVVQLSGWIAMLLAAVIATARRRQAWLMPWIPTLLFYWPIGALSAYLAFAEMFVAPSFWRKTRHGVGRVATTELARARQRTHHSRETGAEGLRSRFSVR